MSNQTDNQASEQATITVGNRGFVLACRRWCARRIIAQSTAMQIGFAVLCSMSQEDRMRAGEIYEQWKRDGYKDEALEEGLMRVVIGEKG